MSSAVGEQFNFARGEHEVVCEISKLPLRAGPYNFNVNARIGRIVVDSVKEVANFEVEAGDYYGSGVLPAVTKHSVYIDYSYKRI